MLCLRRIILYGLLISVYHCLLIHAQGPGPGNLLSTEEPRISMHSRTVDMRVQFEIHEGLPTGTWVGRIPTKPGFTYRFNENIPEFQLNGTTGEIHTGKELDREALISDRFDLVVLSSQPTYPLEVRINILDINDNAPAFPELEIEVVFSENANSGTRVFLDTAEDRDTGINDVTIEYKILDGNKDGQFRLAVTTNPSGETPFLHLETTGKLDRETKSFYTLNISAQDGGNPPKFGYLSVNVTITDINDCAPRFDMSDYVVSLNESVPIGTIVLQVTATDNDDGDNAQITYYLSETETQFSVDPDSGVIVTMQPLICQQSCPQQLMTCSKSCVFTVFARDHGVPSQDGRTYVTVNLLDANDHDPLIKFRYFPPTASAATVDENAQNGSVVAAISVVDMDEGPNGETSVQIVSGNELHHFRLESTPSFQLVRVNGVLDREKISKYNLSIIATDKGSPTRSSTSFLIIEVNDINDHEPVFEKSEYSAVLRELVPIGTYVASITASDADTGINSQVFYSIVGGNEKMWFQVDPVSGLLTTRSLLDREQQGTVRLKISARDGGPNPKWAQAQIKITILDDNDERPLFNNENIQVSLPEDVPPGSLVAFLSASDHDQGTNGSVSYYISLETEYAYPSIFHLDSSTGKLVSRARFDREFLSYYEISVIAKDQGTPALSSTATVQLSISDINDHDPKIYPVEYFVTVAEDTPVGTNLVQILAMDADEGLNAEIKFTLESGSDELFALEETSGKIILKGILRDSKRKMFQIRVAAKDGGGRKCPEDAIVEVLVKSFDEQTLKFKTELFSFSVIEDPGSKIINEGRAVGTIELTSEKSVETGQVRFSIIDGDLHGVFTIDEATGLITAVKTVDREIESSYLLTVLARHGLAYGSCRVNITVKDLNDNAPIFAKKKIMTKIEENSPVGCEVYLVEATDPDEDNNAKIKYSLTQNPNKMFSIDETNGLIYLNKPLRLSVDLMELTVEVMAMDGGSLPLSSRQIISLTITDTNDHTPIFHLSSYETSLLETTSVNSRFFALQATDQDMGVNAQIEYQIVDGNIAQKFGVFPDGYLYVKANLDREDQDYFSLTVLARDLGIPQRSSTVFVVIHVIDENDNSPKFTNASFIFFIAENEPPDTYIGKVIATDDDVGRNAELTYTLSSTQNEFVVDPKNGFVKSLISFDREYLLQTTGQDFITLEVIVQDGGAMRLKDKAQMLIYVTDVNDNKPTFLRSYYSAQVSEGAPIGSQVVRVIASDLDEGLNGDIAYYINGGNDGQVFKVDISTGLITLSKHLDRETQAQYVLIVIAQDTAESHSMSSTASVTVDVLDENDNMPEFTQSGSRILVLETTPVNTELIAFQASDPDLGLNQQVSLSITGGNRHDSFRIDTKSGSLYLNKALDFERYSSYTLNITASDAGNPRLSSSIQFLVMVQDYNDNPPIFPSTAIVRQIQEGIALNTPIVTVSAEDPDSGLNGKVKYSIRKQEPPGEHFGIDPDLGIIHTLKVIDREFTDTFRLTVIATDKAIPISSRLHAEKLVTVIVEDVNDNEPHFICMNAAVIMNNSDRSREIIQVKALDLDSESNGEVTYEMVSGDTSLFKLQRTTGTLTLKRAITELQPRYQVTIRATDEAIQSQRKSSDLYLSIIGVSENNKLGELTFNQSFYKGSIPENEPVGTSVLTVSASIGDKSIENMDIEYYVTNITSKKGDMQDRLFDMDVRHGILSSAAILDRENGVWNFELEIYAIVISNKGLNTASTKVQIEILDRNDSPPTFTNKLTSLSVSENAPIGQEIASLLATDEDTLGVISYAIVEGDYGKFSLEAETGILRIIDALDREVKEEYQVIVRASDGIQYSDSTVVVQLLDENDNAPRWSDSAYSFDIPENAPHGYRVGSLQAVDLDKGPNGQVTYSVLSNWGNDVFSLNPQTGIFTLTTRLDYEDVQHYIFVVQAQDTGKPSLSSTTTVYLNVMDINDNAPTFDPMSYNREVFENASVGSTVVTVSATDLDSGLNGKISYSIVSGNDNDVFEISDNGTIVSKKLLDREAKAYYNLLVQASDRALSLQLSSTVQVNIVLEDINDCPPEFVSPNETFVVENSPINAVLLVVKAVDQDEGRNSYVEYVLNNEKSTFSLGPVDGLLRINGILDRETTSNYSLKIIAKDRGEPSKSSTQNLLVIIKDYNDNSPLFDPRQYSAAIPENSSVGISVLQVSATDVDEGINAQIRYGIVAGDPNRDFNIGEDSGILRLAKSLNYERKRSYTLTVQAEDSGEEVRYDTATITISVTDCNDNPPLFLDSPYLAFVRENMAEIPATVLSVSAFDADTALNNHQVRYLMKDGDKGSFRVNASTGEITVHRALDREMQSEYMLTVLAMDTGSPRLSGTGMVRVVVRDQNDNTPFFSHDRYEFHVEENIQLRSVVAHVVAVDIDEGLNAKIKYEIVEDQIGLFEIQQDTGEILTLGDIDRENQEVYHLTVKASDSSPVLQRFSTVNVTIKILDKNDNPPVFTNARYAVKIPDDTSPGGYVVGVSAKDADSGLNSKIRYYLGGADADKFQINQNTGVIKSLRDLSKSGSIQFHLEIHATDSSPKEPLSSSVNVEVNLVDHLKFPKIKSGEREFSFSENVSNIVVTVIQGVPYDTGRDSELLSDDRNRASRIERASLAKFNFYIGGGNLGNAFQIGNNSGQVKVGMAGLDYETAQYYELWVEVSKSREPDLRTAVALYVNITDTNDNKPTFEFNVYNLSVPEEEPGPRLVTVLQAHDVDSGDNGKVKYRLSSESLSLYGAVFGLHSESGEIFTKVKLDREEMVKYTLIVEAIDLGPTPQTGTATLLVNVEDKNDNPPRFTRLFSVNVTENVPMETFVIQVTSVDKDIGDNANCTYSFTENAYGKFKIDTYSGNVTVNGMLDRESQDEYLLKVAAIDGSWRAETLVTITIQDINDNAPEFEYSYYSFNIPEGDHPVTFVGQVTAFDRDKRGPNSMVSYALKQPSDYFSVDPVSGEIFSKKPLKHKPRWKKFSPENEYSMVIMAADSGKPPMSSECAITINVVDGNNNAPQWEQKSYFSPVLESSPIGQQILRVRATDADDFGVNSELEYLKISGNGTELFSIDKETGWITVISDLAGRKSQWFEMQLRVMDKGMPPQSDDVRVVLIVTGSNNYTPVFSALSYRVIVPENEALGTVIVTVTAADEDEGPNGQILYNISNKGIQQNKFSIDSNTGAVTIITELDFDTKREYHLNISAKDVGYFSRSSEAELTVILTDINDNPPQFNQSLYTEYVYENAPINSKLVHLIAEDKDSLKNSVIRYSIVGGSGNNAFAIDVESGVVITKKLFDYEERDLYVLEVLASNPDSNLYGTTKVQILVLGVNEYFPKFVQPVFHFTVSESAMIGSQIGNVQATDEDSGDDGTVFYLLVGSSNDRGFIIIPNSGAIIVARRLDRESQSRIVLTVLAKNRGSIRGNDTDEAQIIITVQDGNDPPVFEKDTYQVDISEGATPGSKVIAVKASDIDVRPSNNRFSYEILSGNENKTFKIDPISGLVLTAGILDREVIPTYTLLVGAIDTGQPPQTGTTTVRIDLLDTNDNGPTLESSSTEGTVLENEPPGTKIMTLRANDLDLSPNGEPFTYSLIGGTDASKFKVDSKSGHVITTVSFDREASPELKILVEIVDNGSPPMKTRQEVKITVIDKNDCPSQSRNGQLILYTFKDMIPTDKVASVEPLDPDVVGQYTCRLDKNEDVFKIHSNCDLVLDKLPLYKRQSLKILADDGLHAEVSSTMLIEFFSFDNMTMENSVIIRALEINYKKVLEKSYSKLLSFFRQILRHDPHIYSLIPSVNGTDIILASGTGNQYMSPEELITSLLPHKGHLESLIDAAIIINYSPCSTHNICHNGASCSQSLRAYSTPRINDSPLLVLSSPSVNMEFSCQCPSGFTGFKCQLRKEPCQPNPCEFNTPCNKQGYDFNCACPPQRYGKRCELERSSACLSNPCKNGGSCQENRHSGSYFCLCRPGFFGNQCQAVADACRPNPCLNGGECISNIGPATAFPRCKCPIHYYGRYCEKSSFGFAFGSVMSFPSLDPNTNDLSLVFSTNKNDSLIVYNFGEQTGGRSDFVAIQLVEGRPTLSFGGARTAIATISVDKFVADGKWNRIIATRNSRVISLSVSPCEDSGENCHDCRPGDSSCYAEDVGPTGTLNFNGHPLLIGGLLNVEPILERPGQIQTDDFIGCIHSITINGRLLNMSSPLEYRSISDACQRIEDVCDASSHKCGQEGECIDLWDSYACRCNGVTSPNCFEAFYPYSFAAGSYMEFRVGEKYRRSQLMHNIYFKHLKSWKRYEVPTKTISFTFRTVQSDAILLYAASGKDYTIVELENGELRFSSKIGSNYPINMSLSNLLLVDGQWHIVRLSVYNQVLQVFVDDRKGEELDAASGHDFLDPYLTTLTLGGFGDESVLSNKIYSAFTGCISNFTVNEELQPFNGSGSVFDEVIQYGKISRGCSNAIAGAATAPDPLSIGVTLVIVFFVILLVAISVSFVVFRLRKREKSPLPLITPTTKQSPTSQTTGDVVRGHSMDGEAEAIRNLVRNSKKISESNTGYQKPDIIERTTSVPSHNGSGNIPNTDGGLHSGNGISLDPELSEMPEHYDLENASSIAPSDIDIVYHYKGFRDNLGGRNKSSPFRHNHHFSGSHQSPGIRQSPISNVLKSTPLARLSPSSELSQQTAPRILTLQDISGKPLQSALLATTQKDAMSQSERSLNISHSSSRSSIVNASSQGTKKKRKKCAVDSGNKMTIGLTAEEIERLNNSRHKNNSSLVSTLDAVSSSESDDRRKNKLSDLLETNTEILQRARDTSSDEDESGNDSFTCSEFEYDNEKRDFRSSHMIFSKLTEVENEEGEDSFRGSLSTLVASDDDLAYINSYSKTPNPNGDSTSLGWDYLLNWGPNFENLVDVFKDIAELPDGASGIVSSPPTGSVNNVGPTSRNSRYPTPRPSEEYV